MVKFKQRESRFCTERRPFPADYHSVKRGAQAVAGDGVPGEWVDYPCGRPLREVLQASDVPLVILAL